MKIVVCVKQVPDTETRVRIAPEGNAIVEGDVNWIVSPYDEFAIEEALKIKEARGGEVVLVGLGPERIQSALRTGLAMGADSAVHVKDEAFDGADTLATARALAAAIIKLAPFDLVLTGKQGVDDDQRPGARPCWPSCSTGRRSRWSSSSRCHGRQVRRGRARDRGRRRGHRAALPGRHLHAEGLERAALRER